MELLANYMSKVEKYCTKTDDLSMGFFDGQLNHGSKSIFKENDLINLGIYALWNESETILKVRDIFWGFV